MARISILLPVHNVQAYVAKALDSIQSQSISDIEIVVVDDGSTDETLRIVEQLASTDARIKVVRTHRNLGLPLALNFGLPFCKAPFIARMDGDDIALPTRLEEQLHFLEENPDIALVGCAYLPIDEFGDPITGSTISPTPVTQKAITKTMLLASPCSHPCWLARSEIYRCLSGYREIGASEDFDFLLRAVTSGFLLGNLPGALMRLRTRRGQISGSVRQRRAHNYVVRLYRERVRYGTDSFSLADYERGVRTRTIEETAFRVAQGCNQKGIRSGSKFLRFSLAAVSVLLSPWQARYLFSRFRFHLAYRMATPSGEGKHSSTVGCSDLSGDRLLRAKTVERQMLQKREDRNG
jgi:glycosyltransferase involved in cell wall biosynthesis